MSTNKTENYQLHKWEADDNFLRTEFNENFAAIDEALHGIFVTGTYTGNGEAQQVISLGFTPRAVLVLSSSGEAGYTSFNRGGLAFPEIPCQYNDHEVVGIVEGGFRVNYYMKTIDIGSNINNRRYHYLALK